MDINWILILILLSLISILLSCWFDVKMAKWMGDKWLRRSRSLEASRRVYKETWNQRLDVTVTDGVHKGWITLGEKDK